MKLNTTREERMEYVRHADRRKLKERRLVALCDDVDCLIAGVTALEAQARMSLRDWMESVGALRAGARIAWGPVTWTVRMYHHEVSADDRIVNDDTRDSIDLGTCASLPAAGWRALKEDGA